MSHRIEGQRPYTIIRRQLLVLALFPFSEAIAWTSIFPYIYSMVREISPQNNPGTDNNNAAFYAGIMVSVFTFGEFIMAPRWAAISDRIGRKPTLLIGSFGAIFSALAFGLTTSLPVAIIARLCAGMLNPNLGVVPTFIGELVSKDQQAKGFSLVAFIQGFGRMIGPVIGGYLAEPVKNYPSLFHVGSVWDRFPYLLPNLVVVAFLSISCFLGLLTLEEVHPEFHHQEDILQRIRRCFERSRRVEGDLSREGEYTFVATDEEVSEMSDVSQLALGVKTEPIPASPFTRQVMYQILSTTLLGFVQIANLALVPIFLATGSTFSKDPQAADKLAAGFSLDNQSISNILLTQAIVALITQLWIVPRTIEKFGSLSAFRHSLLASIGVFFLVPCTVLLPRWLGMCGVIVMLCAYAYLAAVSNATSQILLTNTTPSRIYLARINGAATSIGCLGRTAGPAVSGWLSQAGQKTGYIGLPFWVIGLIAAINWVVACVFLQDHP